MSVRVASCSCGRLRAEVRGEPTGVSVCHCRACQRRTGSVFGAQARFLRESVAVEGAGTEYVRVGDAGGRFRFTFCPRCGSTVFYVEEGDEQEVAVPVGAFADPSFPAPTISVYEERRHPWVSTHGSLFLTMPSTGAETRSEAVPTPGLGGHARTPSGKPRSDRTPKLPRTPYRRSSGNAPSTRLGE